MIEIGLGVKVNENAISSITHHYEPRDLSSQTKEREWYAVRMINGDIFEVERKEFFKKLKEL